MYFLRKEPYIITVPKVKKYNGTEIPEREFKCQDRAVYKHKKFNRYYVQSFYGLNVNHNDDDTELYLTDSIIDILGLRKVTFEYCGELFDIYNEELNKVDIGKIF